ncbi:MAG: response regulator transcription factor [Spirosomaceae bacterium]|jgi:DNA-binding NarL/FixJ family response regulator|nr:response regulator transcription factor [Spirosomataceae bacterium]
MGVIKVGLVDDNPTLLRNISQNLSIFDELEIDFKAINGLDALDKLNNHQPDVILMDIEMPAMDGIEATREIKRRNPNQKIMMLTVLDREDKIFDAIKAGASGYLLKDEKPSRILACLEELIDGGAPMSPVIAMKTLEMLRNQQVLEQKTETVQSPETFNLSKREVEILEKIANGLNYNQIAEQLFISAKTARKHIENIYQKLHVHSKLEAVQIAQKNRWV